MYFSPADEYPTLYVDIKKPPPTNNNAISMLRIIAKPLSYSDIVNGIALYDRAFALLMNARPARTAIMMI